MPQLPFNLKGIPFFGLLGQPDELEIIENELKDLKEHIVDIDMILNEKEKMQIEESFRHEKEGKLVSLLEFKKNLLFDMFEILLDIPAQKSLKKYDMLIDQIVYRHTD